MSVEENKAIIRHLIEDALNKGNMDIFDEVYSPNCLIGGTATPQQTKAAFQAMRQSMPDFTCSMQELIGAYDKVVLRWAMSGTEASGQHSLWHGITIYGLEDGKIVSDVYQANPAEAPDTEKNKEIVRRFLEELWHWNETTVDEIAPEAYPVGQREPFKAWVKDMHRAFPDLTLTIEELIAEGDQVMVHWVMKGTHQGEYLSPLGPVAPTGKVITAHGISIFRVRGDKIVEDRYIGGDQISWMQQLGVIPLPNPSSA